MTETFRNTFFACAISAALAANSGTSHSQAIQDFSVVNSTGIDIVEIYVSPKSSREWEENVLSTNLLENGKKIDILFHPKEKVCSWDLMVMYQDGSKAEWENVDLCRSSNLTIKYDKETSKTWAEYD